MFAALGAIDLPAPTSLRPGTQSTGRCPLLPVPCGQGTGDRAGDPPSRVNLGAGRRAGGKLPPLASWVIDTVVIVPDSAK